jgi:hypothetical protein
MSGRADQCAGGRRCACRARSPARVRASRRPSSKRGRPAEPPSLPYPNHRTADQQHQRSEQRRRTRGRAVGNAPRRQLVDGVRGITDAHGRTFRAAAAGNKRLRRSQLSSARSPCVVSGCWAATCSDSSTRPASSARRRSRSWATGWPGGRRSWARAPGSSDGGMACSSTAARWTPAMRRCGSPTVGHSRWAGDLGDGLPDRSRVDRRAGARQPGTPGPPARCHRLAGPVLPQADLATHPGSELLGWVKDDAEYIAHQIDVGG